MPPEIILALLNGEDMTEKVLSFYRPYIISASKITVNDAFGECVDSYVDDDLFQTIQIAIAAALPNLKKNIQRHLDPDDDFQIHLQADQRSV